MSYINACVSQYVGDLVLRITRVGVYFTIAQYTTSNDGYVNTVAASIHAQHVYLEYYYLRISAWIYLFRGRLLSDCYGIEKRIKKVTFHSKLADSSEIRKTQENLFHMNTIH